MSQLPNTPDELASLNREIETFSREAWNDRFGGATKPTN